MMHSDEEDHDEERTPIRCPEPSIDEDPAVSLTSVEVGSDSILSFDDEGDDDFGAMMLSNPSYTRKDTALYMEQASMEASLHGRNRLADGVADRSSSFTEFDGDDGDARNGFTRIEASGPLGRRRQSQMESIVVPDAATAPTSAAKGSSLDSSLSVLDALQSFGSESHVFAMSERDVFQVMEADEFPAADKSKEPAEGGILLAVASSPRKSPIDLSIGVVPMVPPLTPSGLAVQTLRSCEIVPDGVTDDETLALRSLFEGFCTPPVTVESCEAALKLERTGFYNHGDLVVLPDQPMIAAQTRGRIVALLQHQQTPSLNGGSHSGGGGGKSHAPILLQLPVHFSLAVLRILIRLFSHESDVEYNASCFLTLPWKEAASSTNRRTIDLTKDPSVDSDHSTKRPHLQYSVARFQCTWMISANGSGTEDRRASTNSQSINSDSRLAVQTILCLWETVASESNDHPHRALLAPLARLLGLLATAGLTPQIFRRMLSLAQSLPMTPLARLTMVRALKTAAAGSSRSSLLSKAAPRQFFCFGGAATGLQRTISGLAAWPFRNDFGMALWFRAEQFDASSPLDPTLVSVRTEDGGGIEITVVPLEKSSLSITDACTIAISIFDSGRQGSKPTHRLVARGGCVLLPRVWYHVAIRHTRSRLKGVFSLSTREQITVLLDGKSMLTESLPFPKISDSDFYDESLGSSLLKTTLRRNVSHSSMNITVAFGSRFEGQTGALHVFNDNVSDASFRALYEISGGSAGMMKRTYSLGDSWDAKRSDLVRKSRVLEAKMKHDDAEEILLSQRRNSGFRKKRTVGIAASVLDLAEGEEHDGNNDLPASLQKAAFGSKLFITWDPRRTLGTLALELHIGAHVNMDGVCSWGVSGAQDVISSTGGVQSLVPLFRAFLGGDIERGWAVTTDDNDFVAILALQQDAVFATIPDLIRLLNAFVKDHHDNARELLRCGGIDIVEQLLSGSKKVAVGKGRSPSIYGALNVFPGLALDLVDALLELRAVCSHNVGLETKIYSRILFNIPLWLGNFNQISGASLHTVVLPVLASLTRMNPEKVRDCVGVKDLVYALKEYTAGTQLLPMTEHGVDPYIEEECSRASSICRSLNDAQRHHASNTLLGMIFTVLASGTTTRDLAPFLHMISFNLEIDLDREADAVACEPSSLLARSANEERRTLIVGSCTILMFLLQLRPSVVGLFESLAHTCGGVQGGSSWILTAIINSRDDEIRSIGIRCIAAYLEVTSRGADLPLTLGTLLQPAVSSSEMGNDVSSTVRRASTRITRMAKGLTAVGPSSRAVILPPSKLTAKVVFKLLWHLLKSHRYRLGQLTHAALLSWITDDEGAASSSLASLEFLQSGMNVALGVTQPFLCLNIEWAKSAFEESGKFAGKSLRNPLALGTVLRLLRFLDSDLKDQWLSDLLALTSSNRKCVSMLASLPEWQPCLFSLISETLEMVKTSHATPSDPVNEVETATWTEYDARVSECVPKRLDLCLHLYSTLLGHLLRSGGDRSLESVERVAALQRVFVNGHHVMILIFSSLCGNIFEEGTLLEVGSLSAQDWKDVDLELESLLLKQSAKLIADSILSNGKKGLDLTYAVRSWRTLRHLTEVIVALVTKSGFGVVDLFDYVNHQATSVDSASGGLHGIRLPDSRLKGIGASDYVACLGLRVFETGDDINEREIDRRLCVALAAQILTLLDPFIFPQSFDVTLPAAQLDGLALIRFSEARLGTSQGPLISSAIRLSVVLLALLEPCSVTFLQCSSRLRCLLCWALELIREATASEGHAVAFHSDGVAHIDRLVLAVVLHCHRALGRCAALLSEIESTSSEKYFISRDSQKKYYRRLLRVALELRDVVSTAFRGRNELLRSTISTEAYEALRGSLEGSPSPGKAVSKESVVRDFLSSQWVTGFTDTITRHDLAIPEQVSLDTIPLSSDQPVDPLLQGFAAVEKLAVESSNIVSDFEKAIDSCFEEYLEVQRKWTETDAVRDLEHDGDTTIKRLTANHKLDGAESAKSALMRRSAADYRWRGIQLKVSDPWKNERYWKLARYTDLLGRRTHLVQNRQFNDHSDASYDLVMGKEREKEEFERQQRLRAKKDLSDVMRRNAEAFVVNDSQVEVELRDDDSSQLLASDGESSAELESSSVDGDSIDNGREVAVQNLPTNDEQDDGWDKIDSEEIQDVDAEGSSDAWAAAFIWADTESVVARFEPVMIVSLQTFVEGKILLTTHGLYFHQIGDEINVITREPIDSGDAAGLDAKDRRWRLTRLTEVHGRRYMLRPQALELFFSDSHELLLNFPGGVKDRDRFHAKLRNSCKVPMLWSPKSLSPRVIFRKSKLTELWKKRKISNFEYLMALNRMAGRSFNDLTQYPVFPWVLGDYTSETIDLTDYRVYRDLSKPVGALNPNRLAQLLERFNELELFGFTEAEKFLYGSHYSSPGIVLHFLIRQEPFTTMAIDLQSGRFDCPDRLFFDVGESWKGCLTSTSDVKELIPEFYCLPEMFLNTNKFPLGLTQSGRLVNDVGLPPWAKGSAYEFVRIHRLALESDFVSQNLHLWVDLIFGYKQRGPEASAAHNIFHHLSYEGSVDLSKIADDVDRNAAESHIQNFGQTPSQLTVEDPHPQRYSTDHCWKPLIEEASAARNLRCHTPSKQFANKRGEHAKGAVLKLHVLSDAIVAIYADLTVGTYRWFPGSRANRLRMEKIRPFARRELSTSRIVMKRGSSVSSEQMEKSSLAIGNWSFGVTLGGLAKEELRRNAVLSSGRLIAASEMSLSTAEASAFIVSCGYWDETVKTHNADVSRVLASETGGHNGAIRCLALGQDGALMVTGGQDGTARVWVVDHPDMSIALSDGYVQTALGGLNDGEQLLNCCHVLWGHDSPIVCVDLDSNIDAVASGSQSGLVCVHTLRRGEFVRSFRPPPLSKNETTGSAMKIAVGTEGCIIVHMEDKGLHAFTVNAFRRCSVDAGEYLHDMKICSMDEILITGGDRCQVLVRSLHDLQVCAMLDLSRHGPIRSIALTPSELNPIEQFLFIGSDDGMITVIDEDPLNALKANATTAF